MHSWRTAQLNAADETGQGAIAPPAAVLEACAAQSRYEAIREACRELVGQEVNAMRKHAHGKTSVIDGVAEQATDRMLVVRTRCRSKRRSEVYRESISYTDLLNGSATVRQIAHLLPYEEV